MRGGTVRDTTVTYNAGEFGNWSAASGFHWYESLHGSWMAGFFEPTPVPELAIHYDLTEGGTTDHQPAPPPATERLATSVWERGRPTPPITHGIRSSITPTSSATRRRCQTTEGPALPGAGRRSLVPCSATLRLVRGSGSHCC